MTQLDDMPRESVWARAESITHNILVRIRNRVRGVSQVNIPPGNYRVRIETIEQDERSTLLHFTLLDDKE